MKLASTIARLLLGLMFLVFGLNFWLKFLPVPPPESGSQAANFLFAMFGSGYLATVKVLEVAGALMLLSGRFVNLGLAILGPIVLNIFLYHVFLVGSGFELPVVMGVLALVALTGRADFKGALLAAK